MKALVYHGPGMIAWEEKPKPAVQDATDAVVKITTTTICGTDLHILKGDVPEVTDGRILGHEGVGVVESVGAGVTSVKPGDKVLISCISSCGKCANCKKGMYSHCENGGGWVLGHLIDGTQAEYVRVPFADNSLYKAPPDVDEEALCMLSDIFPTGFECGVLNGEIKPGDTVAIVGAGPIGLAALLTAQFYSPARIIMVDMDENRLLTAKSLGATDLVHAGGRPVEEIMALTGGKGADVVMEAVGVPPSFDICQKIVAAGGHLASIGVFGKSVNLEIQRLWAHNITLRTRLVDTVSTPMLLKTVAAGKLQPSRLITHRFKLADIMKAYDTFKKAADTKALKVIMAA
ncbi:MAG TPA: zinc-dependent alcohol dehydrogenase family protein [Alphaproteobacteria bacterium]|nr:zinc-dependent alcohol dehydrogenase family protein [Alphaproteobacteria bacterium]